MNYRNNTNDHDFFTDEHIRNFLRNHNTGINNRGRQALGHIIQQYENPSVLDVACGSCVNYEVWRLMGIKHEYIGFDLTQKLLDEAKRRYGDSIKLIQGFAQELSGHFQTDTIDVIIIRHFLEHVHNGDYQPIIKQAFDIATKELDIVFFLEPHGGPNDIIERRSSNIEGHPEVVHYWNIYSLSKFLQFITTLGCKIEKHYIITPGAAAADTIFRLIK